MTRRNITSDFKFKVILEALKERKTLEGLQKLLTGVGWMYREDWLEGLWEKWTLKV